MIARYLPEDDPAYLSRQLITCLGNKRALLPEIDRIVCAVRDELGGRKLRCGDLFSGSGVVARLLKRHSELLCANDLERYSAIVNQCYLTDREDFPEARFEAAFARAQKRLLEPLQEGLISRNYAPGDDGDIRPGERAFYTWENARIIDTLRAFIDTVDEDLRPFFLAPLLSEASIHSNTGGVFKGFYKDSATGVGKFGGNGENALTRILGKIELQRPVLSRFSCESRVFQTDANALAAALPELDLAYLDPPYNQHPYGSNYFMLNVIAENTLSGPLSRVSGIPAGWNRSDYNKPARALCALEGLIRDVPARYVLISYNSEGFISPGQMEEMLAPLGRVEKTAVDYNVYRASRNLSGRETHVREYLFLLKKQ